MHVKEIAIRTLIAHRAWSAIRETRAATFPLDVRPVVLVILDITIIAYQELPGSATTY